MADPRMIPLYLNGQPVELAMTEHDFFTKKTMQKGEHEYQTAAEAGYSLGDYYEDNVAPYEGPKTKQAYERHQDERRSARSGPRAEAPKAEAPKEERKAEAKP